MQAPNCGLRGQLYYASLPQGLNLRIDLGQRGFQSGAAAWIRGSLRKDILALQCERLPFAFSCGAALVGCASFFIFCHIVTRFGRGVFRGI